MKKVPESEDEEYAMADRDFKKFFKRRGNDVVQRSDKWWLPTVKVPHEGLSEDLENGCSIKKIVSIKFLSYQSKNICRDGDSREPYRKSS
nr:hypothetical protein [Tanacetum cinerariifolium]